MAKKQQKNDRGGALGDIAEGLGTLLGNAEKQWKAWQGPRDSIVSAVTDVRDRAAALLAEMGVPEAVARAKDAALDAAGGKKADKKKAKAEKKAAKAGKKADKQAKKAEEKAEKARKADAKKAGKGARADAADGKKGKKGAKKSAARARAVSGNESGHG